VIGRGGNPRVRRLVSLLDGWARAGAQRRAAGSGNVVANSPAVLLMDAWWPRLVRAEFQPAVGGPLIDLINTEFNSIQPDGIRDGTGNGFFAGWEMDVQKDLRRVLHRRVTGQFSRTYCGGGTLRRCRVLLTNALIEATAELTRRYGSSMAGWNLPVTCPVSTPPSCDRPGQRGRDLDPAATVRQPRDLLSSGRGQRPPLSGGSPNPAYAAAWMSRCI
jgi:hypothetical protein